MHSLLAVDIVKIFVNLYDSMGFVNGTWQNYVMLLVSFILMYLAIVKNQADVCIHKRRINCK